MFVWLEDPVVLSVHRFTDWTDFSNLIWDLDGKREGCFKVDGPLLI